MPRFYNNLNASFEASLTKIAFTFIGTAAGAVYGGGISIVDDMVAKFTGSAIMQLPIKSIGTMLGANMMPILIAGASGGAIIGAAWGASYNSPTNFRQRHPYIFKAAGATIPVIIGCAANYIGNQFFPLTEQQAGYDPTVDPYYATLLGHSVYKVVAFSGYKLYNYCKQSRARRDEHPIDMLPPPVAALNEEQKRLPTPSRQILPEPTFRERLENINYDEDIPDKYKDPIHLGLINDPRNLDCGHVLDLEDLDQLKQYRSWAKPCECPVCRKPIDVKTLAEPSVNFFMRDCLRKYVEKKERNVREAAQDVRREEIKVVYKEEAKENGIEAVPEIRIDIPREDPLTSPNLLTLPLLDNNHAPENIPVSNNTEEQQTESIESNPSVFSRLYSFFSASFQAPVAEEKHSLAPRMSETVL